MKTTAILAALLIIGAVNAPAQTPIPSPTSPPQPAYFTLAYSSREPGTERLRGPGGGSLYVSGTPLILREDIARVGEEEPLATRKVSWLEVKLTAGGTAKLAAVLSTTKKPLIVLMQGQKILADEIRLPGNPAKDYLSVHGRFSEKEFKELAAILRRKN